MPGLLVVLGTLALSLPGVWPQQQQQGSLNSTELQHVADSDSVEGDSVDENTTDIAAIEDSSVTPATRAEAEDSQQPDSCQQQQQLDNNNIHPSFELDQPGLPSR